MLGQLIGGLTDLIKNKSDGIKRKQFLNVGVKKSDAKNSIDKTPTTPLRKSK